MKYDIMAKGLGIMLNGLVKQDIPDAQTRKKIRSEYRQILERAGDIGSNNRLFSSYGLAAYFIAMNRCTDLSPEQNIAILEKRMRNSRLVKAFLGDSKGYFSDKHMQSRREWSRQTHEHTYPNDWVVDVVEKTDDFEFGFNYLECGVCKLCRDENCFELAKYLCSLDYMLVEIVGIRLTRTKTLAEGCDCCDFRFHKA